MSLAKGIVFGAVGAAVGAAVWTAIGVAADHTLWILAPVVGGCAGFGMGQGTKMRGGGLAGVCAAVLTVGAILVARYVRISSATEEILAVDEEDAIALLTEEVAEEWDEVGYVTYDFEEDDYVPGVYAEAEHRWDMMDDEERAGLMAEMGEGSEAAAAVMTPVLFLFDVGLFGLLGIALAGSAAYKIGSITLERALLEDGEAPSAGAAAAKAAEIRAQMAGVAAGASELRAGAGPGGRIALTPVSDPGFPVGLPDAEESEPARPLRTPMMRKPPAPADAAEEMRRAS